MSEQEQIKWMAPHSDPFRIYGFPWFDSERKYRRLPLQGVCSISDGLEEHANHTAGGQIHFQTDSSQLSVRVRLKGLANMCHMPATGQCGFDCYIGSPGEERFYRTTRYDHVKIEYEYGIFNMGFKQKRSLKFHFPLYQGVEELWIGIDPDAEVFEPPTFKHHGKVIVYGTSITQGGCASRPGMAYPNILSRKIQIECVNLGFSGLGYGQPEVAEMVASIPDIRLLILDYEANMTDPDRMKLTLLAFISIFRLKHKQVPILVLSKIRYPREFFNPIVLEQRLKMKFAQQQAVEQIRSEGDMLVWFKDGEDLLGEYYSECFVDGIHPTDWGFELMANGLKPVICDLLNIPTKNSLFN